MKKHIGMIAGGSGITPMLQVIHEIIKNPDDHTQVSLIFGNRTSSDILMKDLLDNITKQHPNIKVHYIIDNPERGWTADVGFVDESVVKKYMPPPDSSNLILVCGPPPMVNLVSGPKTPDFKQGELKGVLKNCGYDASQVFKF
eukprot:TRINITY_DN1702_c0_g2_i10.p1 TRINITY_DN1702_c0_g2~~TRINITY_DN1702_c0_g2_i10.p1  ORF type:complete len:143 (+),score=24.26 TRINITY_DN1702_c0_g2_i10:616-1044(+)